MLCFGGSCWPFHTRFCTAMISALTFEEMQDLNINMRRADPRRSLFLAGIADARGPCRTEPEPGSNWSTMRHPVENPRLRL